jgi:SAM-dependent methyltransferase
VNALQKQFGNIDIYLFDQLLRGNIAPGMTIFDAGCGYGRNIHYLLTHGYDVHGVDLDANAIGTLPAGNFRTEPAEGNSFPDNFADVVIRSAVLHFARDTHQFNAMLAGSWRVLKLGGLFFCRLASSIGIESRIQPISERRFRLPDGSTRYLVDEELLMRLTGDLGATLVDPIKTTVVQNQRSMTTWVLRK